MTQQLTVIGQICKTIDTMAPTLSTDLKGTGISPDRFIATAKTAIQTHVQKDRLEKADRQSLYLAIKKSATDGLMPDNREAALVVYGDQVQYQPMVQGLVKMARQSGEIESINSEIVYENDEFYLSYDFDGVKFKHAPDWKSERGKPCLVWASVKLKSGEIIARAYPKERIMQIATRSKQSGNYNPETGKDWEEFWRKAAIRNILKYAPKSTQLEKALAEADSEFQEQQDVELQKEQEVKLEPKVTRAKEAIMSYKEPEVIDADIVEEEFFEAPI
ncbi:rect family [Caudoviricetes sp.]|nr:rect family [Caudoviricetes sp.]